MSMNRTTVTLEKIVSLAKRRGFVYQSAEIYGGLNGIYDFGHLGTLLKINIRNAWKRSLKETNPNILFFEGALLGPEAMWNASGHTKHFHDPMVDCLKCKHRFRADDLDLNQPCPHCGAHAWTSVRTFNMMFKTEIGAAADQSSLAYLRPETAQSMYVNFKNIISTNRIKLPFGLAQIGKAFRNEITPKQFIFRMREFEQMEMQWFCSKDTVEEDYSMWFNARFNFYQKIGIQPERIKLRAHQTDELAHYSAKTTDIEYEFPFGWKELEGIAHRGNYDLTQHSTHSGKDLAVHDEVAKKNYIPDVVECSVGVDRLFLTLLCDAYTEDIIDNEERITLAFHPQIAPIKAAFLPLTKKQYEKTYELYQKISLQTDFELIFDESGSIGKRYRRNDEIGTPLCITYDFGSEQDSCVTIRNRDTTQQQRIPIDQIEKYITDFIRHS